MVLTGSLQEMIYPALGCSMIKKELIPPVEIMLKKPLSEKGGGEWLRFF